MKTVAIINEKGGTAKTTTTVSLAAALGEIGQKVLVVDLDGQAASSRWMGVEGDSRLADAMIAGEGLEPIRDVLPNVDLAPASGKIDSVAHELRPTQGGQLRRVLAEVQSKFQYDYILLDCPPSLGNRLIGNAMLAATHALVPVETSILALDGLRILLTMLKDIRQGFDHNIELLGVLACRYDARTRLSRLILSELHRALPNNVFRTVIHNTIRIQECPAVIKSILEYAPDCPAAKDYRMLAKELVTGEVDVENVEEVEDIVCSNAIDSSDQQTVLDFRHRAAEFFGKPIEDHPAVDAPPSRGTSAKPSESEVESQEGDWAVETSTPPAAIPTDAICEELVQAVTEPASPPEPVAVAPEPVEAVSPEPEEEPVDEFTIQLTDSPIEPQPVTSEKEPSPVRGDAVNWKVRRNAKLVAAGLAIFFVAGVMFLQKSNLFPNSAEANHESLVKTEDVAVPSPAEPVVAEEPQEEPAVKADESVEQDATSPVQATFPETESQIPLVEETPTTLPASESQAETAAPDQEDAQDAVEAISDTPEPEPDFSTEEPSAESEPELEVAPITLTFSGMMGSQGNYSASINGEWLFVGDQVQGATLVNVDPMSAEVEWQNQRFLLQMGEETVLRDGEGEPTE